MPGGDRDPSPGRREITARHRLRIRTIAVSFDAAVSAAHQDRKTTSAERDAQIELWRAWCLDALDGYRSDMAEADGMMTDRSERTLVADLDDAVESVRRR